MTDGDGAQNVLGSDHDSGQLSMRGHNDSIAPCTTQLILAADGDTSDKGQTATESGIIPRSHAFLQINFPCTVGEALQGKRMRQGRATLRSVEMGETKTYSTNLSIGTSPALSERSWLEWGAYQLTRRSRCDELFKKHLPLTYNATSLRLEATSPEGTQFMQVWREIFPKEEGEEDDTPEDLKGRELNFTVMASLVPPSGLSWT